MRPAILPVKALRSSRSRSSSSSRRRCLRRPSPVGIETRSPLDQPWVHAITVPSGPNAGKVCTYVGYGDKSSGYFATVDLCLDALAISPTFTKIKLNPRSALRDGFHIRPKPHSDRTVYVGYQSWQSQSGNNVTMNMVVARDDNWGNNSFGDLTDPSDSKAGRIVANVTIDEITALGGQRPDNGFDVQVDPNDSDVVYICWIDNGGTGFQLHVRRSLDRGQNWSGDLITGINNAALATMAINGHSTGALTYLQLVSGQWETHFRTTTDGSTWDDLLLARTATNGFIGDYMRMVAVGPHFYGVFPAVNTPDPANFFPNGGGTFRFQRNTKGKQLVGSDGTTVISASVDPFFFKVEEKDVTFILNRNPIGQDEVDARRKQPPGSSGGLPIKDAFRVVVDGFWTSRPITAAACNAHLRTAVDMQSISDLVQSSTFIFRGTVLELGASSVPSVPPNEKLITVRINKSLRTDPVVGDLREKTITVAVVSAEKFTAGQQVVFFANSWVHGRGIAVREVAHLDAGQTDRVAAAVAQLPQRHMLDRLQDAEVVVDAKITKIDPPGFTLDQHDGLWAAAHLHVNATLKGKLPHSAIFYFATAEWPPWNRTPRFEEGQGGIFILHIP
jgi:hypothetical protein